MALIKLNDQSLSAVTSAGLPSGTVLQVKYQAFDGITSESGTTSSTFLATGASLSITPSSTSSDILIMISGGAQNDTANGGVSVAIYKDGSGLYQDDLNTVLQYGDSNQVNGFSLNYLDSPSTTSSVTYQIYWAKYNNGNAFVNDPSITLMEIAG